MDAKIPVTNFVLLGDTGFIGSEFLTQIRNLGIPIVCLNSKRILQIDNNQIFESPRNYLDIFDEVAPFISPGTIIINTVWCHNEKSERNSISHEMSLSEELHLINALEGTSAYYLSLGSIAEIDDIEISPSINTRYASAKKTIQSLLSSSPLKSIWIRIASCYGPNDGRDWLIPQLRNSILTGLPLRIENPKQIINLCHVQVLVNACLRLILNGETGTYNVVTRQWLTIEDLNTCTKTLIEPRYMRRDNGAFSEADPVALYLHTPPIVDYFQISK